MTTLLDAYPDLEESGTAIKSVAPSTVSTIFNNCVFAGDQSMGDSYRVNQAGAVGPGSQTHGSTFQQVWLQCKDGVDLRELSKELSTLHAELKSRATDPEHEIAVGSVAAAEKAAAAGDGPKAIEYLKKAGAWALDIAAKIGVGVAIPTIVKALAGTSG